ncbi:MAG: dockerin type I repeat-containing protein [Armatimonadetes bacterium]|nr:dockerin type I repeat-containing protein [Armatimonadota bacterium]
MYSRIRWNGVLLCLLAGSVIGPARSEPTLFVESVIAPPGISKRTYEYPPRYSIQIFANAEVRDVFDTCGLNLTFRPLTPGAPEYPYSYGNCPERITPFNGPGVLEYFRYDVLRNAPEGAVYELELIFIPGTEPKNSRGEVIPMKIVNGLLTVRNAPFLRGDLNDNGALEVRDVVLSLRWAVGLEPTATPPSTEADLSAVAYARASGDANRDGQLTIADSVLILKAVVGLP